MKIKSGLTGIIILISCLLTACADNSNPLIGQWQQLSSAPDQDVIVIEFTPSTMRINDTRVTVVYQVRENKVRVSASKNEIIYEFLDNDSIQYEDKQRGITKLVRVKP